jgi:hypothetical protein
VSEKAAFLTLGESARRAGILALLRNQGFQHIIVVENPAKFTNRKFMPSSSAKSVVGMS